MQIVRSVDGLKTAVRALKGSIGFVPTMGALHAGHISLMEKARDDNDHLIVSIFVNPAQFLEGEDLDSYPRQEDADALLCEEKGVDILFLPGPDQMYEDDEICIGAPARRAYILEGHRRPGHFDGMLQIVMKLLNLSSADRAYFGKKDAQQLSLIVQMTKRYFMSCEIVPCEIVRDENGLALSSRNVYLSADEKRRALSLSRALFEAEEMVKEGEKDTRIIAERMKSILSECDELEYLAFVDRDFNAIERIEDGGSIILIAARFGATRLIDNIWL